MQPLGEALSVLFLCVRAQNLIYAFPSRIQTITSVSYGVTDGASRTLARERGYRKKKVYNACYHPVDQTSMFKMR